MPYKRFRELGAGAFSPRELRRYLAAEAAIFWGLILLAWWTFPADGRYSIFTHTFSFLGSWEPKHNPQFWWIFSTAMTFWGLAHLPLVVYVHRHLRPIAPRAIWPATILQMLGCFGVILVALFPDATDPLTGALRWTDVHEKVAVIAFAGFGISVPWLGGILLADALRRRGAAARARWHQVPLFLAWTLIVGVAVHNQTSWAATYEARKAAALATGQSIGSSWAESLNTYNAFPFWENILIYTLYGFLALFPLLLPRADDTAP